MPQNMASERLEWVEIIEPSSRNIMYANLTTGQCVWDPPSNVRIKKFDENQWWELYDPNTKRFYYYNATSLKTVWHKPQNCDIIPLAKLQQIKQNTEVGGDPTKFAQNNLPTQGPSKPASPLPSSKPFSLRHPNGKVPSSSGWPSSGPPMTRELSRSRFGGSQRVGSNLSSKHETPYHMHRMGSSSSFTPRFLTSSTTQTSPLPSPSPGRRSSHHSSGSSNRPHHHRHQCHGRHQESNGDARRVRRSSQSSQSSALSLSKPYKESGRLSDSSMSQSRTSIESSKLVDLSHGPSREYRKSHRSDGRCEHHSSLRSPSTGSARIPFHLVSPSTPTSQRRLSHESPVLGQMSKQRSFDVGNYPRKYDPERNRELPLSRSYSFMTPRSKFDDDIHDKFGAGGMRSIESTPQSRRRHRGLDVVPGSPESGSQNFLNSRHRSDSSGLESLATPMTHRKQRSTETGKTRMEVRSSNSVHNHLNASDSSPSPPSPRREFSPFIFESPRCPDSGASTLTDKDGRHYGRGSADSSPHSQVDSGLVSGTTGSRGSADSSLRRTLDSRQATMDREPDKSKLVIDKETRRCGHHRRHCAKYKPMQNVPQTTDSDRSDTLHSSASSSIHHASSNHHSSSASSSTAKQSSPNTSHKNSPTICKQHASPKENERLNHRDMAHMYSNLDYVYDQPVYQYIMEQAKLSGYRLGDSLGDDLDSIHSEDSIGRNDDSDEFADDEGISNADSSSQEFLDENYLADDETYTQFFLPAKETKSSPEYTRDVADSKRDIEPPTKLFSNMALNNIYQNTHPMPVESPSGYSPFAAEPPDQVALFRKKEPPQIPPPIDKLELSSFGQSKIGLDHPEDKHTAGASLMMEKYAEENLNVHTKGLLRKKVPVIDMISWTKDPIRKPMLATIDKSLKNQACEMFKMVQIYMSDRKPKVGMTLNSVGLDIVTMAYNALGLRDELFVQISRQTTENQKKDSLRRGWELMAICLEFFPPSVKFAPYLSGYIKRHCDAAYQTMFPEIAKWPIHIQINHYAGVCSKRLERTSENSKRQRLKKPTLEDIDLARLHIFRASMFGGTLEEVMALQRDRYPHRKLPWVQTILSEEILRLQGTVTEGIFRVPADFDEVNQLKQVIDQWEVGDHGEPHVVAALLKLWYRELYHPLIPDYMYQDAIDAHEHPANAVSLISKLPEINRMVLAYLIRFLQYFSQPEIVANTKMDANNLAMVMAPNCLRCMSDDPKIIYENTRKEMAFIRTLIQNLDTTFMEGVV